MAQQDNYEVQPISYKWRKKPVVIEAFQMKKAFWSDDTLWPDWLIDAWGSNELSLREDDLGFKIGTLEGPHLGDWDDYIIRGVKGELYACKPDVFILTYERVADAQVS